MKYYYQTINGKSCRLNEKQTGVLLSRLFSAILANRFTLTRFPNGRESFAYAVYMHGVDENGDSVVIRYYVDQTDDGVYSTTPIALSYSTFTADLLSYGDELHIESPLTAELLKVFYLRGA